MIQNVANASKMIGMRVRDCEKAQARRAQTFQF